MEVRYRESFLRDLKKLKRHALYKKIHQLAFQTLPEAKSLSSLPGVKAMSGYPRRFRIRVGSYRIGLHVEGSVVELVRVVDRRDFYRYFP